MVDVIRCVLKKGSLRIIENGTIRKLGYGLLFVFYSNYCCIFYRFGDKARYWSKIAIFLPPLAFDDAPVRGLPSEYQRTV